LRWSQSRLLAKTAIDEFGHLDIWVNNAGGNDTREVRPPTDVSDADFEAMLDLNLMIPFSAARAAAARMNSGGVIVNVASCAGMRAAPNQGLRRSEGRSAQPGPDQWLPNSPTVASASTRYPGMMPTEAFFRVLQFSEAALSRLGSTVPLGRLGTPEDMAAAVLYLASPAADWVTGQNLLVADGSDEADRSSTGKRAPFG
jgi:NAD(P)-dependent dehydrogenase (short-subunit alcohol dehydrogenase family)